MRLNVGTWSKMGCPAINVRINGLSCKDCIEADEEKGFVINSRIDLFKPRYMLDVPTERIKGQVQIILGDDVR